MLKSTEIQSKEEQMNSSEARSIQFFLPDQLRSESFCLKNQNFLAITMWNNTIYQISSERTEDPVVRTTQYIKKKIPNSLLVNEIDPDPMKWEKERSNEMGKRRERFTDLRSRNESFFFSCQRNPSSDYLWRRRLEIGRAHV